MTTVHVSYMSWLRNRVGKQSENITLPPDVQTLSQLIDDLSQRENYSVFAAYRDIINASVNGEMVQDWKEKAIKENDKITFFSPIAGG